MKTTKTIILVLLSVITLQAQEGRKYPRPLNEVEYNIDEYNYELESIDPSSLLKTNDTINITWQKLNGPYGGMIGGILIKGDTIIAKAGGKGILFISKNKGLTWEKLNIPFTVPSGSYIFTDYGSFLLSPGTGLYETTDFINWTSKPLKNLPKDTHISKLAKDSKGGIYFYSINRDVIYYSNDSCKNWKAELGVPKILTNFMLANNGDLYAGGYDIIIVKRKDSTKWVDCSPGEYVNLGYNLTQDEQGYIYAGSGNRSEFFESIDSGKTWRDKDTTDFLLQLYYHDLTYSNGTLITAGWPDYMLSGWGVAISKDKGSTWEYSNEGLLPYSYANDLATSGEDTYLGMYGGGIYRSSNQGEDWHPWMTGLAGASSNQMTMDNDGNLLISSWGEGVQRSKDDGFTWENLLNKEWNGSAFGITVDSSGIIYTGGDNGIYVSNDNGTSWSKNYSGVIIYMHHDKNGNIYGVDRYNGLLRSHDKGKTWINLNAVNQELFSFTNDTKGNLYVGQYTGSIRKSEDNGDSWKTIKPPSSNYHVVYGLAVSKNGTIWAANDVQGLVKSTDDGLNWEVVIPGRAWRVFINDKDEIFFAKQNSNIYPPNNPVYSDGGLFYSKDEGKTWSNISGNMSYIQVNDILFKDDEIYLSTDESMFKGSLPLGIENYKEEQIVTKYSLSQNYPNPFNPSTTINYALPEAGYVTLKIYNTLGEEVTTLVNEYKQTGNHQVSFKAKDLSSGLYIYKLNANGKTFSKKMMLLK